MPVNTASFYGASRPALGFGGRSDYALDPRRIMAIELMKNGASTAPVQSPLEGLAKALQAGVGGYFARDAKLEQDQRQTAYGQDMAKVLAGAQPKLETGQVGEDGLALTRRTAPGGYEGMAQALAGIENPDVQAMMGPQIAMAQIAQQQAEIDRQNKLADAIKLKASPGSANPATTPSNIMEWEAFQKMTPAERDQYLTMKRAIPPINLGGTVVQPSPTQPGVAAATLTKTVPPEQTPGHKADVKTAEGAAEASIKQKELARKNQVVFDTFKVGLDNLETAMGNTTTNPVTGSLPAVTAEAQIADGSAATLAPVLKNVFREAGEGTFTDKDQEMLLDMVPTRTDHPEARKAKIKMITQIVSAKLGLGGKTAAPVAPTPAAPAAPSASDIQAEIARRGLKP